MYKVNVKCQFGFRIIFNVSIRLITVGNTGLACVQCIACADKLPWYSIVNTLNALLLSLIREVSSTFNFHPHC